MQVEHSKNGWLKMSRLKLSEGVKAKENKCMASHVQAHYNHIPENPRQITLKAIIGKWHITYKGTIIQMTENFSSETTNTQRHL